MKLQKYSQIQRLKKNKCQKYPGISIPILPDQNKNRNLKERIKEIKRVQNNTQTQIQKHKPIDTKTHTHTQTKTDTYIYTNRYPRKTYRVKKQTQTQTQTHE